MKKKLIPILCLMLLFCLTACSMEGDKNFDYDKGVMIDMTKSIVTNYKDVKGAEAEYLLTEGDNVEKTAVAGFQQAQTTDEVGTFESFNTSDDVTTFENGAKGDILCSIIAKFSNRDVRVTVSFSENKLFTARYEQEMETLEYYAKTAQKADGTVGYASADEFVQQEASLQQLGYRTDTAAHFITDILVYSQTDPVLPYKANECEVSAVYSTGELLAKGAKNMGVGMGVVFCVLIFIALIIYLLRFVPKLLGKEIKAPGAAKAPAPKQEVKKAGALIPTAAAAVPKAAAKAPVSVGEEVKDGELIAVITAALHAYLSEAKDTGVAHPPAYTASNDTLVVRSIRRVS